MTSATFAIVNIDEIVIDRDNRQRKELSGIEELAKSIHVVGLINPIVISADGVLVAGERRLTACRSLGWTRIPVQYAEELSEDQLYLIELEENVKRSDLTWQDQVAALARYHSIRAQNDAEWSGHKTANALGISHNEFYAKVKVAEALASGDEMVCKADKYSVARGIVERQQQREKASAVDKLIAMTDSKTPLSLPDDEFPEDFNELLDTPLPEYVPVPFLHTDFSEWAMSYSGPRFNFLHCDFPYGVNAGQHNQGAGSAFGGYDDGAEVYWHLLDVLAQVMDTLVADSAHMMFWFSMDYYHETKERLASMGWKVNPFPLIWHKSDNSGILPDPKRGPRRVYETAFLCTRGDRFLVQAVSNTFAAPNLKVIHMSEKNMQMLQHFFRMFVDEHTLMLDPTMGSGNAVRVAEAAGATKALGLERDEKFYTLAVEAYKAAKED